MDIQHDAEPGAMLAAGRDGIDIACAQGVLRVISLQRPGGKRIGAADYLNARPDLRLSR
jgi:methionyl-tRNA formyltransferase